MSTKKNGHKLSEMTGTISASLGKADANEADSSYAYSASFYQPRARHIEGRWAVLEHTVDGVPYTETFASSTFGGTEHGELTYDAIYEFSDTLCLKRVMITCEITAAEKKSTYEYRMNVALTWEIGNAKICVKPVLGYQYSCLDGTPIAVHELPPSNSRIDISVHFENGFMILEDGTDIKKLGRLET